MKKDKIPYVVFIIIVIIGMYLNFSIQFHDKERRDFCLSNGFEGYGHELTLQIFYCYKNDQRVYMASYDEGYDLLESSMSCATPQFEESKICLFFTSPEISCQIEKFKNNIECKS